MKNTPSASQKSLDKIATTLIVILLAVIGLIIAATNLIGIYAKTDFSSGEGPLGPITVTFSAPVIKETVEPLLSIDPVTAGRYEWPNPHTVQFIPAQPLDPKTTYRLHLRAGKIGSNGEELKTEQIWQFNVRSPLIAYLKSQNQKNELWVTSPTDNSLSHRLASINNSVLDLNASKNGEFIALSVLNQQNGSDIWQVDRDGSNLRVLVICGADTCSSPAIAPDNQHLAYVREAAGIPGAPASAPRIWILDLKSGNDQPLLTDSQMTSTHPIWAPDGTHISVFDSRTNVLRVIDISTESQIASFPATITSAVSWSPDSSDLLYTNLVEKADGAYRIVNLVGFSDADPATIMGTQDDHDYNYSDLAWNPNGRTILISFHPTKDDLAKSFWLVDPKTLDKQVVFGNFYNTSDWFGRNEIYWPPHWDLWGQAIVMEQFQNKNGTNLQVAVWAPGMDTPKTLTQGFSPVWLP